jgi:hypothetical protein
LLDHLTSLGRPLTTQARVYGLIWEPGKTCSSATSRGHQYAQAITQSGGISGSVCNADYTAPLKAISQDFTAILKAQFELATTPDAGTLQVKVNDVVAAPSTYSLAGRIVTFNSPPPLAATIKATYIVGSTPIVNKFALGERPAAGTLEVKVNGAVAAANLYSVNAAQELVFGVAPAAAAEIRASFRQDVALPARLPLAAKIKPGSLQVQVNGVFVNDVTHDGVDLVFVDAPADAAVIDVAYLEDRGPILTYDLLAVPAILVSVTDATTGEPVAGVSVAGASVVFDAAAFGDGRQLIVRYRDEVSVITSLKLTQAPLPGSLRLDSEDCQLGDVGTDLTVSLTCSDPGAGLVTVRYTYATARLDEFVLSDVTQPDAGTWAVFLDGEPVLGFARVGSTITLPDALRQQFAADTSPRTVRVVYSMD